MSITVQRMILKLLVGYHPFCLCGPSLCTNFRFRRLDSK